MIIFRLRTGHNKLNKHLHTKLKAVPFPMCSCGQSEQDTTHILQECRVLEALRKEVWPEPVSLEQKLHGCEDDLHKTANSYWSLISNCDNNEKKKTQTHRHTYRQTHTHTHTHTHTQTNCSENINPPRFCGGVKRQLHYVNPKGRYILLTQEQRQGHWFKVSPEGLSPEIDILIRSPFPVLTVASVA